MSYVRPKTHESIIQRQNEVKQTTPSTSRETQKYSFITNKEIKTKSRHNPIIPVFVNFAYVTDGLYYDQR
jgi:ribosomal protein S19